MPTLNIGLAWFSVILFCLVVGIFLSLIGISLTVNAKQGNIYYKFISSCLGIYFFLMFGLALYKGYTNLLKPFIDSAEKDISNISVYFWILIAASGGYFGTIFLCILANLFIVPYQALRTINPYS